MHPCRTAPGRSPSRATKFPIAMTLRHRHRHQWMRTRRQPASMDPARSVPAAVPSSRIRWRRRRLTSPTSPTRVRRHDPLRCARHLSKRCSDLPSPEPIFRRWRMPTDSPVRYCRRPVPWVGSTFMRLSDDQNSSSTGRRYGRPRCGNPSCTQGCCNEQRTAAATRNRSCPTPDAQRTRRFAPTRLRAVVRLVARCLRHPRSTGRRRGFAGGRSRPHR